VARVTVESLHRVINDHREKLRGRQLFPAWACYSSFFQLAEQFKLLMRLQLGEELAIHGLAGRIQGS
jgi:hypothetical protein